MASALASCPSIIAAGLPRSAVRLKKSSAVSAIIVGTASRILRAITVSMPQFLLGYETSNVFSAAFARTDSCFRAENLQRVRGRAFHEHRAAARDFLRIALSRGIDDAAHQGQRFALASERRLVRRNGP